MKIVFTILLAGIIATSTRADAALLSTSPVEVCAYLNNSGLKTRSWKSVYGSVFQCSSLYREIGSDYPLANNLAFYGEGTRSSVESVKLVLNVNARVSASAAHDELLKAAKKLSVRATGNELSQALLSAIGKGENTSATIGPSSIEVRRMDWPTGKGYEIHVIIK